ncbi:MAG: beta-galactosidase [Planctomycetes bacterium]|nr:beta-galactosidase [Planctomycetota bacterium]
MYVGADYYPEHWPEERWETDARLMKEAGLNIVRVAEFAWVNMEPEEGAYRFDWLDRAIETLGAHGIGVILGTPTAAMPAWVADKYPETLAQKKDGTRVTWGMRKNNCFTSGAYRMLSERITRAMAVHYAGNPHVAGWQTDNEIGGHEVCYCASCRRGYQDWLRRRYGTLQELNRAWGTHFWSEAFGTWGEITIPDDAAAHNPSAYLDWRRFFSDLNVEFQADQLRILRKTCPGQFVTHNFMGLFREINYYDLAEDLDFVSWDNYPVHGKPGVPYGASMAADVMRGLKKKNFWIMEQTSGTHGWGTFTRNPRPGEIRKIAYQQVARGADAMIWFRWRACTAGREQYWHGVLGHDGKPLRRYREIKQTAGEYHALAEKIEGTTLKPQAAIVYDYESHWALAAQPAYRENRYHEVLARYYDAFYRAGISVDMIRPDDDPGGYRLVLAPDLYVMPDETAARLAEYVRGGGILLTDCRSGVKDESGLCHERTLPGLLGEALGISIEEYESMPDFEYRMAGANGFDGEWTARHYADWVTPVKAEVLARYGEWHMEAFAALTRNRYGDGYGYYMGTVCGEEAFYDALAAELAEKAGIRPILAPPAGVEATMREGNGRKIVFLVNHTEEEKEVGLPFAGTELISGKKTGMSARLGRYGVAVIEIDR